MESGFFERVNDWLVTQGVTADNATKVTELLKKRHYEMVEGLTLDELEVIAKHYTENS